MQKIEIHTRDGACPSYVFRPSGEGPWPAVLVFMDGPGMRPQMQDLAARLASNGYFVLLPDLFYRSGPYAPVNPKVVFSDPTLREAHLTKYMNLANGPAVMSDTAAFLEFLAGQPDVTPGPIGVIGYCMGGRLALIAAGTYPDRIGAMASYHGGNLATDKPDSPHTLASKIKAKVYIGGATQDASFTDEMKQMLDDALSAAGVAHTIETYPAKHGWVLPDTASYDAAEAEHHWRALVPFLDDALKG